MAGKIISTGNKDLSCLRCRKKKAKCSKTRPTCTRCSRSNQPCEYPDAPPNLTDLSQKVLTLYDTLKELEGEFLVKYMQTMDEDTKEEIKEPLPALQLNQPIHQFDVNTKPMIEEPAGWSMSLTPQGLSIHVVTRNLNEFNEFIKSISGQVIRDFGSKYLPYLWDPDAEGYFEQESDTEELEEDSYLVTIPVFSISSLLCSQEIEHFIYPSVNELSSPIREEYFPHIIQHLRERYKLLEKEINTTVSHHLIQLMLQIQDYLKLSIDTSNNDRDELSYLCLLVTYIISTTYFPLMENNNSNELINLDDCLNYTKMKYLDYILRVDEIPSYELILCSTLLAWIDNSFIFIAIRLLCNSNMKINNMSWQVLISSLVFLDIQSATFQFKKNREIYDILDISKLTVEQFCQSKNHNIQLIIILEAKLMYLLHRVITLFYQVEEKEMKVRKIDVDEVLTLVRDMELWEQELPKWAKWKETIDKNSKFLIHMHMIYNMVKILLFRPFSITLDENQEEQTLTKTTFLDMSIQAADKLTTCLVFNSYKNIEYWTDSARHLVNDVSERVIKMFDKDEEIVEQLEKIQLRLQIKKEIVQ